jgi:uncharacterized membrane protein (UPF0182 family)
MSEYDRLTSGRGPRVTPALIFGVLLVLFLSARSIASFVIEVQWRKELNQLETWVAMLTYGFAPVAGAAVLAFLVLWLAHARGMKWSGTGLRQYPFYGKLATLAILGLSVLLASATVHSWTVVRYAGSRGFADDGYRDPVFNNPLTFYFFEVPFYRLLLGYVLAVSLAAAVVFWVTSRFWSLRELFRSQGNPEAMAMDLRDLDLAGALGSNFVRAAGAVFLLALAIRFYLSRYDLLLDDHGSLVGIDWVAQNLSLPLIWLKILAAIACAAFLLAGRFRYLLALPAVLILAGVLPSLVTAVYVRPSEITIQRPFIERHITATRSAYGLTERTRELEFQSSQEVNIDPTQHRALLENVRLWDWKAFHDTVTQIQALRPYYVFNDSDVDRYVIDGQLRQVLLTPRELDVRMLSADARARWVNPNFVYTHGYGIVMAEASQITREGLPKLLVQDAPPTIRTKSLQLTRPEIYFGEVTHSPVFVRTELPEFDYPAGSQNVETRYAGKGGFPVASPLMRLAAAVSEGDWNIMLTSYLRNESRMMIRRNVRERLEALAGFLNWDDDPYLVVTQEGRLMWVVDGYTSSSAHPYARIVSVSGIGSLNYLRNSVKATIDAYDGNVTLYVFDDKDPVLASYRRLFPKLFVSATSMSQDLRSHLRYPEKIFRVQAEIYRVYHMTDPEAFFNKEDLWDMARSMRSAGGQPQAVAPTYIIAALPGSDQAEFLLTTTFTPRGKDNLIGMMIARCDGDALGELVFLQLSKQALMFGPLQIAAQINQDQNISKDLSLWNQQGSEVLRGHMLVLPVENTFIYIEPIYLQASSARMPQLKKVVIASGNRLIYSDTYEEAILALGGQRSVAMAAARPAAETVEGPPPAPAAGPAVPPAIIEEARSHLRKYREYISQGRYAEAGREMEALERLLGRPR